MARYHGFTCPKCGSHMFGTHTHFSIMGNKYPHGTRIGSCHEHQHSGNGCDFTWIRTDEVAENACVYNQSYEEWMKGYQESIENIRKAVEEDKWTAEYDAIRESAESGH